MSSACLARRVDTAGESLGIKAQPVLGTVDRIAIGHAGDPSHRRMPHTGLAVVGEHPCWQTGRICAQVFDQRLEHGDDPMGLIARLVSEVDVLVVERSERRKRRRSRRGHADQPGALRCLDHRSDETRQLGATRRTAERSDLVGQVVRPHDASRHCVLEVVADVGDAVSPRDDLSLGGLRCRTRPGVVSDAVECLRAEVERFQGDVSTPDRMVEPAFDVWGERVLGGVATRPVATVVPERDRFGERHVQPERPTD